MTVPFYGHVKQYRAIQQEIDTNIREVLESGQYVMGPMLKRFEQELAAYHGMKYAVGVGDSSRWAKIDCVEEREERGVHTEAKRQRENDRNAHRRRTGE